MAPREAAIEAAGLRLRAIVMTSLAFGLGCVPLAIATGPGANSLRAIGTGVIGGILASTVIAILFAPLFFWMLESLSAALRGQKAQPAASGGALPLRRRLTRAAQRRLTCADSHAPSPFSPAACTLGPDYERPTVDTPPAGASTTRRQPRSPTPRGGSSSAIRC